jgi:hypothetical protein
MRKTRWLEEVKMEQMGEENTFDMGGGGDGNKERSVEERAWWGLVVVVVVVEVL